MDNQKVVAQIIAWLITNKVSASAKNPKVAEMLIESVQHRPLEFYNWVAAKMVTWADDVGHVFHLHITEDQFGIIAKHVTEAFRRELFPEEPQFILTGIIT